MGVTNICLDTDILIDHLRNQTSVVTHIRKLEEEHAVLSTTSINAFELIYGAWKTENKDQNVRATKVLLDRLAQYEFDAQAAELAGEILATLESAGQPIGYRDLFIGATVLVNNAQLFTRNVKHFQKVPGLQLHTLR